MKRRLKKSGKGNMTVKTNFGENERKLDPLPIKRTESKTD